MLRAAAAVVALALPVVVDACDIFVGTLRAPSGSREDGGHLYCVDVASGSSRFIGRILVDGAQPIGITAMAFHPHTNVLYGITSGLNDAKRTSLLTIDAATGEARVVARLSRPLSDISFAPDGRLFGWTLNTSQLALVDTGNGSVSTIGHAGEAPIGGAFAIDSRGNAYVAPWSAEGRLDRIDLALGTTVSAAPISSVDLTSLRAMAFSGTGELLATQSVRTSKSSSTLVRIDTETGKVNAIAAIPEDSEAIAVTTTHSLSRAEMLNGVAYAALAAMLLGLASFKLRGRLIRSR